MCSSVSPLWFFTHTTNFFLIKYIFDNLDNINKTLNNFYFAKEKLEAKVFAINESISAYQLSKFKNNFFEEFNNCSLCLYSNNINTILAGKSLKIDSTSFSINWMTS